MQAYDDEMRERIARGAAKAGSPSARRSIWSAIEALPDHQPVLIDCLTLWLTNHMPANHDIEAE